jgi:hypothetical protein
MFTHLIGADIQKKALLSEKQCFAINENSALSCRLSYLAVKSVQESQVEIKPLGRSIGEIENLTVRQHLDEGA